MSLTCKYIADYEQAIVAMSSLLIFSSVRLRKKFYEIFLLLHIALSVLLIVSLFQ